MRALQVLTQNGTDPTAGAQVCEVPSLAPVAGWIRVRVEAASLNHHDLWSLRGVGLRADALPMTLGTDATGTLEDGSPVLVHAVIGDPLWREDETLDPKRTLLSELYPGTLAQEVWVPAGNVVPRHPDLSIDEAACLPTAYLTAYRLLFSAAVLRPGQSVLIQGAGGGVATASILLARAAGLRVLVTSRSQAKAARAAELGAHAVFGDGERIGEQVDAVIETVGEATWAHSLRSLRPGGVIAVAGATSGAAADADLNRMFFKGLRVVGSTMGTRSELARVQAMMVATGVRPIIDRVVDLDGAANALGALDRGEVQGKVVVRV